MFTLYTLYINMNMFKNPKENHSDRNQIRKSKKENF